MEILYIGNKLLKHGSTPTGIDVLGAQFEAMGYQMHYGGTIKNQLGRLSQMLTKVYQLRNRISCVLIDTYASYGFWFAYLCGRLAKALGVPYICILRGGSLSQRLTGSPTLAAQLFEHSFANVAISGYMADIFEKSGFKTFLIPNTIDLTNYSFQLRNSPRPRLLWVRSFHEVYNPTLAVDILTELLDRYKEATLCMVGPDKDGSLQKVKAYAKEKGVRDQITFTGRLSKSDWIELSAQFDFFINTTNVDNTPVSVMEAMAVGLPVVTTKVGGIPFLFKEGVEGIMVPPNDAETFVSAITDLIEHPERAARISQAARAKAKQWDWNVVKDQWKVLFERVSATAL